MSILNLLGLRKNQDETKITQINVTHAYDLTSSNAVTLIDVRTAVEWRDTGLPKNSHGITLQDPSFETKIRDIMDQDKSKPIAFICKTGGRSSQGADKARVAGHQHIYNVTGGFLEWSKAGLPIDKYPF